MLDQSQGEQEKEARHRVDPMEELKYRPFYFVLLNRVIITGQHLLFITIFFIFVLYYLL